MKNLCAVIFICGAFHASAQNEGICGKVLWVEGNQMPGPGLKTPAKTVVREIHVYEVATMQQTTRENGLFKEIRTNLIATTFSKRDGTFKIKLPSGKYSVFTKEEGGLFANLFDEKGAINPVTVERGKFTNLTISVNYKAAY
jgi:hypothetical protein